MKRRQFVAYLGGAAATLPLAAHAQQASPLIGFLGLASAAAWRPLVAAFRTGLDSAGYTEGKNVAIAFRWAESQPARLPALAADLVDLRPAVIIATGGPSAVRAAMAATKSIPIVFTLGSDPVEHGLVASLGRPGGNVTGIMMIAFHLIPKKLEILHSLVPKAAKIGVLVNPASPSAPLHLKDLNATALSLGRQIVTFDARTERELEGIFELMSQQRIAGLLVVPDPRFDRNVRLIALAARYALPTMYTWREDVEVGGLISYGISIRSAYRQAGEYAGRILKGEKPSALPVLSPNTVEMTINLKTAKSLRIAIPDALLLRADDVIE